MNNDILLQLAHTDMLPPAMTAAIFAGTPPAVSEMVLPLLISVMDTAAVGIANDEITTKCVLRTNLAIAFLAGLLLDAISGPGTVAPEVSQ